MRILIIEDSVRLADTIADALRDENYIVDIANDGLQEMSKGKTDKEIQQIAANLCKQRGIDMNAAYKQFTQMFGAMFNRK